MNAAPLTIDARSTRAARVFPLSVATSAALHAGLLAAALLWRPGHHDSAAAGFVVEVAFIEGPAAAVPAVESPPVPDPAPPIASPAAAVAEAHVESEPVEPEIEPPPPPLELAAAEPLPVPLPLPPRAKPQPPVRLTAPAPRAEARPAPKFEPQPRPEPPAHRAPTREPQLASAAPAPHHSGADDVAAAPAGHPADSAATSKVSASVAAVAPGPVVVTNPRFRERPTPPHYPRRAIDLGHEGEVIVRALVGPDGESREIRLWRSSGVAALDEAALRAVRRWAFEAARIDGRPVEAWVEVPVRFQLRSVL